MYIPKRLGILPAIEADECLSSYLVRLACRHGILPHTLCHHVWPQYAVWTRDIDRCANVGLIQAIEQRTGLSSAIIESMTLRPLMALMIGNVPKHGISRWIVPIGVYHRMRHAYGQRYCPACLAQAPRYARRAWRLAHVNMCFTHHCLLQDACPQCDRPFIPHRHDSLLTALCHHCGADLAATYSRPPNRQAVAIQSHLQRLLENDPSPQDEFNGWHEFAAVLARLDRRFAHLAGQWLLWRQSDRNELLGYAFKFHEAWPQSFVDWAAEYRVSQAYLKDFSCESRWFSQATCLLPDRYQSPRKRHKKMAPVRQRTRNQSLSQVKMEDASRLLDVAFKRLQRRQDKEIRAS